MSFLKKLEILAEEKPARAKVNRDYDIPYLAGYSNDGSTVYLDKDLPGTLMIGKRSVPICEFIEIHELTEKALEDRLGYSYQEAHKLATRAEEAKVKEHRLDPKEYEKALKPYVRMAYEKKNPKLPPDLDMTPYKGDKRFG